MADARPRHLVIGIGNPDRGDDGAGRLAAQRLRGLLPPAVGVVEHDGEATSLLAELDGAETAILIDASVSAAAAGSVRRFDVARAPLPRAAFSLSSHGLGLAEAVELARVLGQLPERCIVYAVEAAGFDAGGALSAPVCAAVDEVVARVRAEIGGIVAPEGRADA
jgi:hydrogenase maturation protease